jgi:3-methyladenine DNA glycosylase AlkD
VAGVIPLLKNVIDNLRLLSSPKSRAGMKRYAAGGANTLGVSMPNIRRLGKEIGRDHDLALGLWNSDIHEARILASIVAEPEKVTKDLMQEWVEGFDSWDVCDQVCGNLFDRTPHYYEMALKWAKDDREFVKRAAFAVMAWAAVHDKEAGNKQFIDFFEVIKRESTDNRNYVRKAVNWSLRQIGKSRNKSLYELAIKKAKEIYKINSKTAKWIAGDAIRELNKEYIKKRFY